MRILVKDYLEAQNLLKPCLERINALQGNFSHIETLRILYLVLHISCSCFGLGQVRFPHRILSLSHCQLFISRSNHRKLRSCNFNKVFKILLVVLKKVLNNIDILLHRDLNDSILLETYIITNPLEQFTWLSRDHLNVLVYLVN